MTDMEVLSLACLSELSAITDPQKNRDGYAISLTRVDEYIHTPAGNLSLIGRSCEGRVY